MRARLRWTLAAAVATHAGAAAWVGWRSAPPASAEAGHVDDADAVEIAIEETAETASPTVAPPADDETLAASPVGVAMRAATSTMPTVEKGSPHPTTGHALLRFDTDGAGVLGTVLVLDSSSGRPEWDEVARQMVAEGRRKPPLRVPAGARGVSVTVEVTSAMKTLEGGDPPKGTFGKVAGAVMDPIGTVTSAASHEPLKHVVAARVVGVEVL